MIASAGSGYEQPYREESGSSDDVLLSRRQAAASAGVHYNSIRAWEKAGLLRAERHQVGRRQEVRIHLEDLERLLRTRSEQMGHSSSRGRAATRPTAEEQDGGTRPLRERIAALEGENRLLRELLERYLKS
ncbi:MAG: hypothetical protein H0U53_05505 [Actinobacteria bacterium]|nr:hypothetical protein [Actinomycetota bacterium]